MAKYNTRNNTDEKYVKFLQVLASTNSIFRASNIAGLSRSAVYYRRDHDPKFKAEWDLALEESVDELEFTLRERALYGTEKPVFHQGEICGFVTEHHDDVGKFLLRGQKPEKYGNKVEIKSEELADLVELMTAANARIENSRREQIDAEPDKLSHQQEGSGSDDGI